ncbi:MAG: hypothetical protein KBE04_09090 [Phycisphaerae bacterium]|nr:hypothetical protein [Phycisphaerae bacterium]
MLSFMRDQQEAAGRTSKGPTAEPTAQPGEQEYLTVAGKTRRTRQSTIAVIVLFAVGLVGVGLMVRKSQPRAAVAAPAKSQESQIEAAIGRLTGVNAEMSSHMDQIVQKFHEFSAVAQVAVDELVKNPFELERGNMAKSAPAGDLTVQAPEPASAATPPAQVEVQVQSAVPVLPEPGSAGLSGATPDDLAAEEARRTAEEAQRKEAERIQQHQQQVRSRAGNLRLQSILQSGEDTRCLIDDTLVRIGDQVKGFRVMEIGDHWVQLQWSEAGTPDLVVTLRMTE